MVQPTTVTAVTDLARDLGRLAETFWRKYRHEDGSVRDDPRGGGVMETDEQYADRIVASGAEADLVKAVRAVGRMATERVLDSYTPAALNDRQQREIAALAARHADERRRHGFGD